MRWEKVFLSYATQDLDIVNTIAQSLKRIGIEPYIADRQVGAGLRLADKIVANIADSNCFVPVLTHNSERSHWVNQEIGYAQALRDYLFTVPLAEDHSMMRGFLEGVECVSLLRYDLDDTIYRLMLRLRDHINRHFSVLRYLTTNCSSCKIDYVSTLPTQEDINQAIERAAVFPISCPKCKSTNKLEPRTFRQV